MSFYSNFLTMCNNIGKTPSKVVTEVGLKKSAVTRWKAGGNPTDATAQKIADYFGVPVSELTEETKKRPPRRVSARLQWMILPMLFTKNPRTSQTKRKRCFLIWPVL